ncbi:MAG: DUF1080 domain-containing protein [Gemmatimonadaceae bacterium]
MTGCSRSVSVGSAQSAAPEPPPSANTLSAREQREGWKLLFDGKRLTSTWRAYQADTIGPEWRIVDSILTKTRPGDDIVTREQFGDFELAFDWKVSPRGNAGVFIRATEAESKIYWSGPEFQIADDSLTPDSRNPLTSAGAAYGLYAPPKGVAKFGGAWNKSRIVARGPHVEHWMNGQKTIEYEAWSPEWKAKVAGSKFNEYPKWGLAKSGFIGIQGDHGGTLELKNIKIRVIK